MAMLPLAFGPPPARYAQPALRADAAGQRYAAASRRQRDGPTMSAGAAEPTTIPSAAENPVAIKSATDEMQSFTHLQVAAIRIGISDALPLPAFGRLLARLGRFLLGTKPPNPLADERLEALRLVVIALRRRHQNPADAIEAALVAGIPRSQLDALTAELRRSTAV
jgi:hypothetical protein